MSMKNPLTPAGIEPATFRFVARHLNHCATVLRLIIRDTVHLRYFLPLPTQEQIQLLSRQNYRVEFWRFYSNVAENLLLVGCDFLDVSTLEDDTTSFSRYAGGRFIIKVTSHLRTKAPSVSGFLLLTGGSYSFHSASDGKLNVWHDCLINEHKTPFDLTKICHKRQGLQLFVFLVG